MNIDITSFSNPKIKNLGKLLDKKKERDKQALIIIEGKAEIELACQNGVKIKELFYSPELNDFDLYIKRKDFPVFTVSKQVFSKISYREGPDGFLAVAVNPKKEKLSKLKISSKPLVVILEGVEKPGNLGAVLRTADASGTDAVIINQERTDIYNPNVIRSSLGTVFSNQVVGASIQETSSWLKSNNISVVATVVDAKKEYTEVDFSKGVAILMGEENRGLSEDWKKRADEKVSIPMKGKINSLNISVSAAVIIYEALKQRTKKN